MTMTKDPPKLDLERGSRLWDNVFEKKATVRSVHEVFFTIVYDGEEDDGPLRQDYDSDRWSQRFIDSH